MEKQDTSVSILVVYFFWAVSRLSSQITVPEDSTVQELHQAILADVDFWILLLKFAH